MLELYKTQIFLNLWSAIMVSITLAICWIGMRNHFGRCKELTVIFAINLSILLSDTLAYVFRGNTSLVGFVMVYVSNFLVFFLIPILVMAVTNYLVASALEKGIDSKSRRFILHIQKSMFVIIIVYMFLLIISQFTGIIYFFDENNCYVRGPWYEICIMSDVIFWAFCVRCLSFSESLLADMRLCLQQLI